MAVSPLVSPPSTESVAYDHALLQEFKGTKYYEVLYKYLELMTDDIAAKLINDFIGDLPQLRLYQGMLQGLKMCADLPDSVERLHKIKAPHNVYPVQNRA